MSKLLFAVVVGAAQAAAFAGGLVPIPQSVVCREGEFRCRTPDLAAVVRFQSDASLPPEGYRAEVATNGISVWSADSAGAFYAVRTLGQWAERRAVRDERLADVKRHDWDYVLKCVEIKDAPRFRWRALLMDEARHFLGKEAVLRQLDLMAEFKLNVFHWHLVDDQGWRLDLPRHPELAKYGAVRPCSVAFGTKAELFGPGKPPRYRYSTEKYGPFAYTPEDVREVLAYARARHITVVPEIELPGHERALLAARPDLSCLGESLERVPRLRWGVEKDVLCAGNDETVHYLEGVLDEVCEIFGDLPYFHIGGDECPKDRWKACPRCQARMRQLGAKDERELQAWLTRHFTDYLLKKGYRTVGWDEVLFGEVPKNVIGMIWRPSETDGAGGDFVSAAEAAARGHDLVLTPCTLCYFSQAQGLEDDPYPYHGAELYADDPYPLKSDELTLERAYGFDPYAMVAEKDRAHILGVQACVWGEAVFTRFDFEWKAWPRACALAEIAWSGPGASAYADFRTRMESQRKRLIVRNVNCAPIVPSMTFAP